MTLQAQARATGLIGIAHASPCFFTASGRGEPNGLQHKWVFASWLAYRRRRAPRDDTSNRAAIFPFRPRDTVSCVMIGRGTRGRANPRRRYALTVRIGIGGGHFMNKVSSGGIGAVRND
jgi:hypothetical protein